MTPDPPPHRLRRPDHLRTHRATGATSNTPCPPSTAPPRSAALLRTRLADVLAEQAITHPPARHQRTLRPGQPAAAPGPHRAWRGPAGDGGHDGLLTAAFRPCRPAQRRAAESVTNRARRAHGAIRHAGQRAARSRALLSSMLTMASQSSLTTASSDGKWPRALVTLRVLLPPGRVGEGGEGVERGLGGRRGVDLPQLFGDLGGVAAGDRPQGVADQVHHAALHDGGRERGGDGVGEPGQPVDAGDQDVADARGCAGRP